MLCAVPRHRLAPPLDGRLQGAGDRGRDQRPDRPWAAGDVAGTPFWDLVAADLQDRRLRPALAVRGRDAAWTLHDMAPRAPLRGAPDRHTHGRHSPVPPAARAARSAGRPPVRPALPATTAGGSPTAHQTRGFAFSGTPTTDIYTLSLHGALDAGQ